jgi:hypothetical protein
MSGGGFIDNIVDSVVDPVKDAGSWIDDKVNEEIPMGWIGVAALAGGAYLGAEAIAAGNAAEAAAIAEGATAAEAAAAGASAAASADAAFVAADAASLASQGLSEAQIASTLGSSGVEGFVAADAAGLASQGLTEAQISGGLSQSMSGSSGFVTSPTEFGVIGDQAGDYPMSGSYGDPMAEGVKGAVDDLLKYNADYATPSLLTPKNALDALRLGNQLFGQQPQPYGGLYQGRQNQRQAGMVDYSPTLSLLNQRTSTPNVYSLLG